MRLYTYVYHTKLNLHLFYKQIYILTFLCLFVSYKPDSFRIETIMKRHCNSIADIITVWIHSSKHVCIPSANEKIIYILYR